MPEAFKCSAAAGHKDRRQILHDKNDVGEAAGQDHVFPPCSTGMCSSPSNQTDTDECALTPAEKEAKSRVKIIFIRVFRHFKDGAVFFGHLFFELPLCHREGSALQKMQILNQEKRAFACAAKCRRVLLPVGMNIAMAEFVIQISQTQFDIVDLVLARRGRKKVLS